MLSSSEALTLSSENREGVDKRGREGELVRRVMRREEDAQRG